MILFSTTFYLVCYIMLYKYKCKYSDIDYLYIYNYNSVIALVSVKVIILFTCDNNQFNIALLHAL